MLLEDQGDLVDEEEGHPLWLSLSAVLDFLLDGPSQEQGSNESLARSWMGVVQPSSRCSRGCLATPGIPVSRTTIVFCALAFSNISIWNSRGLSMIFLLS